MIVFHTSGAAPSATITALLLAPDNAGTSAEVLTALTTTANAVGTWEFRQMLSQAQAAATFGVSGTYWQITEPQGAGNDPVVWSVQVTGTPDAAAAVSSLTAQPSPPPIFGTPPSSGTTTTITASGGVVSFTQ